MTDSQSGHSRPRSAGGVQTVAAFRARRLAERAALRQRPAQPDAAKPKPTAALQAEPVEARPLPEALPPAAVSPDPEPPVPDMSTGSAPPSSPVPASSMEMEPSPSVFSALLDEVEATRLPASPPETALDVHLPSRTEPQPDEPVPLPFPAPELAPEPEPEPPLAPAPEPAAPAKAETLSRPVLGLGPGMRMRLQQLGYSTIDDLAHAEPAHLREALGEISQLIDIDAWIASARRMRG